MSIKTWHVGKIMLVWVAVGVAFAINRGICGGTRLSNCFDEVDFWFPFLGPALIVAFVITWKWLSASESRR